ncbi:putative armadillo-type protein [Blattamonas nauphoetae]|uniref:Armadillo-type protein n=1 Tax=Blattamonas nauphoetae TaxID=2049346 RepID=A0ABQ9YHE9_9EUKA|nr:putative armadillo-type protein [Blattamonas nauphoetae]
MSSTARPKSSSKSTVPLNRTNSYRSKSPKPQPIKQESQLNTDLIFQELDYLNAFKAHVEGPICTTLAWVPEFRPKPNQIPANEHLIGCLKIVTLEGVTFFCAGTPRGYISLNSIEEVRAIQSESDETTFSTITSLILHKSGAAIQRANSQTDPIDIPSFSHLPDRRSTQSPPLTTAREKNGLLLSAKGKPSTRGSATGRSFSSTRASQTGRNQTFRKSTNTVNIRRSAHDEIEFFQIHNQTANKEGLDRRAMATHRPSEDRLAWGNLKAQNEANKNTLTETSKPLKSERNKWLNDLDKYRMRNSTQMDPSATRTRDASELGRTLSKEFDPADDKAESDDEGHDELNLRRNTKNISEGHNPDYGRIFKAISVIGEGNIGVVNVAVSSILECDLTQPRNQLAIRDCGGIPLLAKYLSAPDDKLRCSVGTVFSLIAVNPFIQVAMYDMKQTKVLVDTVCQDLSPAVQAVGLDATAKLMDYTRNRTVVREAGGIKVAVMALKRAESKEIVASAAKFLHMAFKSKNCRVEGRQLGALSLLLNHLRHFVNARTLKQTGRSTPASVNQQTSRERESAHKSKMGAAQTPSKPAKGSAKTVGRPTPKNKAGTASAVKSTTTAAAADGNLPPPPKEPTGQSNAEIQQFNTHVQNYSVQQVNLECLAAVTSLTGALAYLSLDAANRQELLDKHTLLEMLRLLKHSKDTTLLTLAVRCIGGCCAGLQAAQHLFFDLQGIQLIRNLLSNREPTLLTAICDAIREISAYREAALFVITNLMQQIIDMLKSSDIRLQIHAAGAIETLARFSEGKKTIREKGGLLYMIRLLTVMNDKLLVNVCNTLALCASEQDSIEIIAKSDGLRLLWSLFKSDNNSVITAAAFALTLLVADKQNATYVGSNYVGALAQVVELLTINDNGVRAAACAVISKIGLIDQNLHILVEVGVMPLLASLASTKNPLLRRHLSDAISSCCRTPDTARLMGKLEGVLPCLLFFKEKDKDILRSAASAIRALSFDASNCLLLRQANCVAILTELLLSEDATTQNHAADAISNIRRTYLHFKELQAQRNEEGVTSDMLNAVTITQQLTTIARPTQFPESITQTIQEVHERNIELSPSTFDQEEAFSFSKRKTRKRKPAPNKPRYQQNEEDDAEKNDSESKGSEINEESAPVEQNSDDSGGVPA